MYLSMKEQTLLDAARRVHTRFLRNGISPMEQSSLSSLADAIKIYDEALEKENQLAACPAPATATMLPDRMYSAHLWIITEGGLYQAHMFGKGPPVRVYGPNDLHIVKSGTPHQICVGCVEKMTVLEARKKMVTAKKLRELQHGKKG